MIRAEGVCKSFDKKEVLTVSMPSSDPGKGKFDYRKEWFREDRAIEIIDWFTCY